MLESSQCPLDGCQCFVEGAGSSAEMLDICKSHHKLEFKAVDPGFCFLIIITGIQRVIFLVNFVLLPLFHTTVLDLHPLQSPPLCFPLQDSASVPLHRQPALFRDGHPHRHSPQQHCPGCRRPRPSRVTKERCEYQPTQTQ